LERVVGFKELKTKQKAISDKQIGSEQELLERLRRQPAIRAGLEALLDIAEDTAGEVKLAGDAESRLLQEIRGMGRLQGMSPGRLGEAGCLVRQIRTKQRNLQRAYFLADAD
jgi:hypothetical protein